MLKEKKWPQTRVVALFMAAVGAEDEHKGAKHGADRRGRARDLSLSLPLSLFLSLPMSVPAAYFSIFTIPDLLANQPSRLRCSIPLTHTPYTHTRTHTRHTHERRRRQQRNNRKGPPLLSLAGPVSNLPGGGSCYHH